MWSLSRTPVASDGSGTAKPLPDFLDQVADYQSPFCYLAGCRILRHMLTSCKVNLPGGSMYAA